MSVPIWTKTVHHDGTGSFYLGYRKNGADYYTTKIFWEDSVMADPLATVNADLARAVAWYKSKPLYAGAAIGFLIGQVVYHFLKV